LELRAGLFALAPSRCPVDLGRVATILGPGESFGKRNGSLASPERKMLAAGRQESSCPGGNGQDMVTIQRFGDLSERRSAGMKESRPITDTDRALEPRAV